MTFNRISSDFSSHIRPSTEDIPSTGNKRLQPEPPEDSTPAKKAKRMRVKKGFVVITEEARAALQQYSTEKIASCAKGTPAQAYNWKCDTQTIPIKQAELLNSDLFRRKVFNVDYKNADDYLSMRVPKTGVSKKPLPEKLALKNRVTIDDTERATLNEFLDRAVLRQTTLAILGGAKQPFIANLLRMTKPCVSISASVARRINEIFCAQIFKKASPLNDLRDGRHINLVIRPEERSALKTAMGECGLRDTEILACLLNVELEIVDGLLQERADATILRDHAIRINQIFDKKIFDTDGQRDYVLDPVQVERSNDEEMDNFSAGDIFIRPPDATHEKTPIQEMSRRFPVLTSAQEMSLKSPLIFFADGYLPGRKVLGVNETEGFVDVQNGEEQPRQAAQKRQEAKTSDGLHYTKTSAPYPVAKLPMRKDRVEITEEARLKLQQYSARQISEASAGLFTVATACNLKQRNISISIKGAHLLNTKLFKERVFNVDDRTISSQTSQPATEFLGTPFDLLGEEIPEGDIFDDVLWKW
jgi:hypothetical protein